MSSYLKSVGLILAGLCFCGRFSGVAGAEQPPLSVHLFDASGRPLGNREETVQIVASGQVVDAETRKPLPAFYLTTGSQDRERTGFDWAETSRHLFTNGAFSVQLDKGNLAPAVLIEADGYLPQCSGPIRGQGTNMTFLLKKGGGPAGVILTPDGSPAAGRTVWLSRLKDLIVLGGARMTATNISPEMRATVTDAAGRFSFAPDIEAFGVVVVDEAGFAEVRAEELASSPQARLQPWARVEGTLKIGTQPGSNETIRLAAAFTPYDYYPRRMPPCAISAETTTDRTGRFVFPRVPPVDIKLFHAPKMGRGKAGLIPITQITNLTLRAGETRVVNLGGQGRAVTGRVVLKNYKQTVNWPEEVCWIDSQAPEPADCPSFDPITQEYHRAMHAAMTEADKDAAQARYLAGHDLVARQLRAYYASPAGRKYWFSKRRFVLRFAPDGSFRIDDVPGGTYGLTLDLREPASDRDRQRSPVIATHQQEIEVPDSPGGRSDTPFDVGVINLIAPLKAGDTAPDFAVPATDGKTLKLSDFRGKLVLLDFWAASSAASLAEIPELKETYAAFKNDPRLAVIGLNLDSDIASTLAFATKNQMGWMQGCLGQRSASEVPDRFGVQDLPLIMLIDPNGRVLVNGLRGRTIKSTLDAALANP